MFRLITVAVAITFGSAVLAAPQAAIAPAAVSPGAGDGQVLCKFVVTAERGSKPFQMCQTKA